MVSVMIYELGAIELQRTLVNLLLARFAWNVTSKAVPGILQEFSLFYGHRIITRALPLSRDSSQ